MRRVLTLRTVLGVLGVVASFSLFWLARDVYHLTEQTIRSVIFLKLLVAGHLTIYITRNDGALWQWPFPSWRLVAVTERTQVLGTLAAVYGWVVEPIGRVNAGLVWACALAWLFVNSTAKIAVLRMIGEGTRSERRHLVRVTARLGGRP